MITKEIEKGTSIFKSVIAFIGKTSWNTVAKFIAIAFVCIASYWVIVNISSDRSRIAARQGVEDAYRQQQKLDSISRIESARISRAANKNMTAITTELRETTDADRCMISSFHDGKRSSGGLDYDFFDEGYEQVALERGVEFIVRGNNKNDIKLSEYPIFSHLSIIDHPVIYYVKDIYTIDPKYALLMKEGNMDRAAFYFIYSEDNSTQLGVLSLSWKKNTSAKQYSDKFILDKLKQAGDELRNVMTLKYYTDTKQK